MNVSIMQDLEIRLQEWGAFRNKEICGGLGYPAQSAFCNVANIGRSAYTSEALIYPEIEQTDKLIRELGKFDALMEKIIREKYCPEYSDKKITDFYIYTYILKIFKSMYYRKLDAAKSWLAGAMFQLRQQK